MVHATEIERPWPNLRIVLFTAGDRSRLQGFEGGADFARSLKAQRRVFGQAALDNRDEPWWHMRRQSRWRLMEDRRANFQSRPAVERQLTRSSFVEKHAECPNVALVSSSLALQDFGSHVGKRSN